MTGNEQYKSYMFVKQKKNPENSSSTAKQMAYKMPIVNVNKEIRSSKVKREAKSSSALLVKIDDVDTQPEVINKICLEILQSINALSGS